MHESGAGRPVDVLVVGGGVVGLAATAALVERGVDVVCLESGRPGGGQSSGKARLLRHFHDHRPLVAVCARAREGWDRWEATHGRQLIAPRGVLTVGDHVDVAEQVLREAGLPTRRVDALDAFALGGDDLAGVPALVDERAGIIDAEAAIGVLRDTCADHLAHAQVLGIAPVRSRVLIATSVGRYEARHVLVCAGVDSERLVAPLGVRIPVEYACHARLVFRRRERFVGEPLPGWIDRRGISGMPAYGLPIDDAHFAVGFGGLGHDVQLEPGRLVLAPAQVDELDHNMTQLRDYVSRALPGLDPSPVSAKVCLTTTLTSGGDHFGAFRDGSGTVTAFVGNNLFKFAPELGTVLAGIAVGEAIPDYMLEPAPATAR